VTPGSLPVSALRVYRVTVRGVFDGLDDGQRAFLRERAGEHDLLTSGFTEEGALTAGELSAVERLDALGVGYRGLRSSAVCTDDIRIRR
jgi:hypothetical protein